MTTTNPDSASQVHQEDFEKILIDSGMPTTDAAIKAEFQAQADSANLGIANNDSISPFYRVFKAMITLPVLWLMRFVIEHVMPNAYLKTAGTKALDLFAYGVGLERFPATKAQGYVDFYRANASGELTISAGAQINTDVVNGQVFSVITLADSTLIDGETTKAVLVEALQVGTASNLGANYYRIPDQPISGIDSVTNQADWLTKQGRDIEANDDLRERIRNQFASISQWHTDSVYKSIVSDFTGLSTNQIYLRTQAPRGAGTADILILFKIGEPSASYLQNMEDHIKSNAYHGLGDDIEVQNVPPKLVDLVVNIQFFSTITEQEKANLLSEIEQFIRCAFRENTLYELTKTEPYKPFAFSRLIAELHAKFPLIESMRFDRETIEHGLEIARLNSLTVTNND